MQVSVLKSVLETTKEFAVYPTPITWHLPHWVDRASISRDSCPLGIPKATIIEDGSHYVEMQMIGACGDKEYPIKRRNGTLVEFAVSDLNQKGDEEETIIFGERDSYTVKKNTLVYEHADGDTTLPYTEIVERDGEKFVHMVVSRKAIIGPWGEYSLVAAQRAKAKEEANNRARRLLNTQARLMGVDPDEWSSIVQKGVQNDENKRKLQKEWQVKFGYLNASYETIHYDIDDNYLKGDKRYKIGQLAITLDQAEKILSLLTPKQLKALKN